MIYLLDWFVLRDVRRQGNGQLRSVAGREHTGMGVEFFARISQEIENLRRMNHRNSIKGSAITSREDADFCTYGEISCLPIKRRP